MNEQTIVAETAEAVEAPETTVETPAGEETTETSSENAWGAMLAEDAGEDEQPITPTVEKDESTASEETPPEATPEGEQKPSDEPAAEKPAEEKVETETPVAEPEKKPEEAEPQPQETTPELTDEQLQAQESQLKQLRETWVTDLAQNYQLSEQDKEAMLTEPEKVLPNLAARIVADAVDMAVNSTRGMLVQAMPGLVQHQLQARDASTSGEKKFFDAWPELTEHREVVERTLSLYRQVNPKATLEEAVKVVGPQAWVAAGLSAEDLVARMANTQRVQTVPVQTPTTTPTPATPSASRPVTPTVPANEFTALAEEFLSDD